MLNEIHKAIEEIDYLPSLKRKAYRLLEEIDGIPKSVYDVLEEDDPIKKVIKLTNELERAYRRKGLKNILRFLR